MKSGDASITTKEIAGRIEAEVRQVSHVSDWQAAVTARGKRIEVVLDVQLDPGADLAQAAEAACRNTQTLVEQRLEIELAQKPRARLRYRELRLGQEAAATRGEGTEK